MSSEKAPTRKKRARIESAIDRGMSGQHVRRPVNHFTHLRWRRFVAKRDEMMEPALVPGRQRFDVHVRDLAVRHAEDRPIQRPDARRAEADVIDGPDGVPELQDVAHAHRLVDKDGKAPDDVFQRLLRGQGDGNAADAQAGKRSRGIDAEVVKPRQPAGGDHQHVSARRAIRSRAVDVARA